jgi:phage terminase small subunit
MAKQEIITLRNGEEIRLSEREKMFCEYYLGSANKNATQAAISTGYAEKTARATASRLLTNVNIKKYLDNHAAPLLEALGITQERVLRERANMAFTNLTDLVDNEWRLKNKDQIDPKHYAALNQVTIKEKVLMQQGDEEGGGIVLSREISYKIADKDKSLAVLEEMTGLTKPKAIEGTGPVQNNFFGDINNYINSK